ncbi:MAG: CYTH domain-containing protein [Desulfobacteraceae bacterium]|nr:MAG: CYTH domain-containing protein [Desulfobacteraceae bacterium]
MGIEIERKFLVKYAPWNAQTPVQYFIQGYIQRDHNRVVRVRIADDQGFLTIKGPKEKGAGLEFEYEIPKDDALTLIETLCDQPCIEKNRYHINHQGFDWVIDEFFNENQGLVLAEIELSSVDQDFVKPEWLGKEVTHDLRYYNASLIERPYVTW